MSKQWVEFSPLTLFYTVLMLVNLCTLNPFSFLYRSCFCSLLIILIVVWKLKQQYSNYQYSRVSKLMFSNVERCNLQLNFNLGQHMNCIGTPQGQQGDYIGTAY